MESLPQESLKQIAALIADRSLSQVDRESRALAIAGTQELATRALDWLPEAFGLVALGHMDGIELPTTFSARDTHGTWHEFPMSLEPLFEQSVRLALETCHSDTSNLFKSLAEKSSCVNAVDNALNAGQDVKGCKLSGPALVGIHAETYATAKPVAGPN